jgi:hypothetical protein
MIAPTRRSSPSDQAWNGQPRGVCGESPAPISEIAAGFAVLTVFAVLTGSAIYSNSSNIGLVEGGIERSAKMGFAMFEFAHAIAI